MRYLDVPLDERWVRLKARNAAPDVLVVIPRHVLEFWAQKRFEAPTADELTGIGAEPPG